MTTNQKGYIDSYFTALVILAGIGLVAIVIGVPYLLYWLFTNFSIVML